MKIEIWSDVVCPWCYIGKRKFEKALAEFPQAGYIEVEWKSFQLSPETRTDTTITIYDYLSRRMGVSLERAQQMNDHVTEIAAGVGLTYHMGKVTVANTFNAHRLIHFAKSQGKQGEMKERLLKAYFTDCENIDDYKTLARLASEIGLDSNKTMEVLESGTYTGEVKADIEEARQLRISGVPFFVIDRKYGISGAQETTVFLQTLDKAFTEWVQNNPGSNLQVIDGKVCRPGGECD